MTSLSPSCNHHQSPYNAPMGVSQTSLYFLCVIHPFETINMVSIVWLYEAIIDQSVAQIQIALINKAERLTLCG